MQNKANFKTEDSLSGVAIAKTERQNTEDSKIMAKDTPNVFYNCREYSTNRPYFLQNKANFQKSQMNVNSLLTMDYENISDWTLSENKPNSNPISVKAKMNANIFATMDYENETAFRLEQNKPKQSQFQT